MTVSGGVIEALLGTAVLVVAMALVAHAPGAPPSLKGFAAGFGLFCLRYAILMAAPALGPIALVAAESAHLGGAAVMAGAAALEFGRPLAARWLVLAWAALTAWLAVAVAMVDPFIQRASIVFPVGLVLIAAGIAFWRRSFRVPGAGYRWVAVLFVLLGTHKLEYPVVMEHDWLIPTGFLLTQVLSTALAVAMIVAADRDRRHVLEEEQRQNQKLLELQSAAVAAAANAMLIVDQTGRIEWVNDAFVRLSGYPAAAALGAKARHLLAGSEAAVDTVLRMFEGLAAGGPWRGEAELRRKDGTLYTVDQTVTPISGPDGKVAHYVVVQEDITERRRAEERVRFLSNYDLLTGLPNRLLFRDVLQRTAARAGADRGGVAVLLLDLDDLSKLNDTMGHEAADRVLVVLVERLAAAARGIEVMARVGGDEFGFVLAGDGPLAEAAAELAQSLIETVLRPCKVDGHNVHLGASIGISLFPADGGDAETLVKNAEIAMYRAMREAPDGFRFFAPAMDAELAERRRLDSELRHAVTRGELELHYQPQVDIRSRRIIGFEALLRWNHAVNGWIPPVRFIPVAEDGGIIDTIGEWVMTEACRQAKAWIDSGLPRVPMSVNLSAVQLKRPGLPAVIQRVLDETRLPASLLELELTESTVMHDPEAAERILDEIKSLGVRLAIDDFGTGYSSLARLKRFPVDKLKVDRSFVADLAEDPNDAAIARAIIHLGHSLGLQVVSEGVETEVQFNYLAEQGCDAVQGWLFSPAVPADQAAGLLSRGDFADGFPPVPPHAPA